MVWPNNTFFLSLLTGTTLCLYGPCVRTPRTHMCYVCVIVSTLRYIKHGLPLIDAHISSQSVIPAWNAWTRRRQPSQPITATPDPVNSVNIYVKRRARLLFGQKPREQNASRHQMKKENTRSNNNIYMMMREIDCILYAFVPQYPKIHMYVQKSHTICVYRTRNTQWQAMCVRRWGHAWIRWSRTRILDVRSMV